MNLQSAKSTQAQPNDITKQKLQGLIDVLVVSPYGNHDKKNLKPYASEPAVERSDRDKTKRPIDQQVKMHPQHIALNRNCLKLHRCSESFSL
jgi:hypothetical protein